MLKVCVYITVYCIHMTGLDLLSLYDLSVDWFGESTFRTLCGALPQIQEKDAKDVGTSWYT